MQNISAEMSNNTVLGSFKTLFPFYILKIPQLQQDIMIASLNPNTMNPFMSDDFTSYLLDDFVFSDSDTIATIL
jgi:hypothetical protein